MPGQNLRGNEKLPFFASTLARFPLWYCAPSRNTDKSFHAALKIFPNAPKKQASGKHSDASEK